MSLNPERLPNACRDNNPCVASRSCCQIDAPESGRSSVRQLPIELLAEVFTLACEGEIIIIIRLSGRMRVLAGSTAVTLSRVCHHWRRVIASTHNIWTRIHVQCDGNGVRMPNDGKSSVESALSPNFLESIIERSGTRPLHLTSRHPKPTSTAFETCICSELMDGTRSRILTLDIRGLKLDNLATSNRVLLPSLRQMSLRSCTTVDEVHFTTPLLTSFSLYCEIGYSVALPKLAISWASLTEFNLLWWEAEALHLGDLFDVLRQTDNLSTLRFNPGIDCRVPAESSPPVRLSRLRILAIQDQCNTFLYRDALAHFETPLLEQLDYSIGYDPLPSETDVDPTVSILSFLLSLPNLKLFRLGLLQDGFFDGVFPHNGCGHTTSLDHVFYLVHASPASVFASVGERMFISWMDEPSDVATRLLTYPDVERRRPLQCFWPEGGDLDDVFGTVIDKTEPWPRITSNMEERLVRETTMDFMPYIGLLCSDSYRGERAFLIHYPTEV
ncbi:hypothetical protein BKA70DRAFT_757877 [Coprinopsis sp. MPI-PUGE-AT-0042]|nr:hypothetical protein BKA70DRAFT_757877 [Coprinopsis sp. MPI-PUGE-AT-0042]